MPSTRDMDKPDGLLTILRRAIMAKEKTLAYTIARRCSQEKSIYFSMYCDFMMRILLEDKFPHGKQYFRALRNEKQNFKKSLTSKGNIDLRSKDQKYADIAYSIASLDTNHSVFEETFNVLYQYVYQHEYTNPNVVLKTQADLMFNSITAFEKREFKNDKLMISTEKYKITNDAVWDNYSDDKLCLHGNTLKGVEYEATHCWSNDHALREVYLARASRDKSTCKVDSPPAMTREQPIDDAFEAIKEHQILSDYNAALFKKRTSDGCTKLFNYLYPHAENDDFKTNMKSYLHTEGYTHYVGTTANRRISVLQHLRHLARCKAARLKNVTVADKSYSIDYLSFDSKGWKVQLKAPAKGNSTEKASTYPYLLQQYKISYPRCAGKDEKSSSTVEIEIGEHARVEQSFNVIEKDNCFKFESIKLVRKEIFSLENLSGENEDDKRLALLQILIYRYKKGYRTTLSDIRYEKNYISNGTQTFMMYSLNNNTNRKPNRSHPDIWQQLLYYQVPRSNKRRTYLNSYVAKIIDTLQTFLAEKGHRNSRHEPMKFFKWLREFDTNYVEEFTNDRKTQHGLWWRLIDSLDTEERSDGKYPNREGNLTVRFNLNPQGEGCSYIRDEFCRKNV